MKDKLVSVVVPVFNSQETLEELTSRISTHFASIDKRLELVYVDDCSKDNSWAVMKALRGKYASELRIVRLRRNSGQHNALLAGISIAKGDVIVTLDDDLQNPPEEISKLLNKLADGFELVIAGYGQKQHAWYRNFSGSLVDRVLKAIFKLPRNFHLTSFRAMTRHVAEGINQMEGVYPYLSAMALSQTDDVANVEVVHEERKVGQSNYTLLRSVRLALNLLLNYSVLPVIFVGLLCGLAFLFSFGLGGWVLFTTITSGAGAPGWASIMTAIAFFNSLILLCMFIFSIYISRLNRVMMKTKSGFAIADLDEN